MFFISDAYAAGGDSLGAMVGSFLPLILIFVAFWFFLIRPQQKRQKEHTRMINALSKGDEILTAGGIAGRVVDVQEQYLIVQISKVKEEPVLLTLQRIAIQTTLPKGTIQTF